jgi:hypothetical protein
LRRFLATIFVALTVPLSAAIDEYSCGIPNRYLAFEGAILYATTLNGSIPYATVWPTDDAAVGVGQGQVLTPSYEIGYEIAGRAFIDWYRRGNDFLEMRASELVINSGAIVTPDGFFIGGSSSFTDGFAKIHTRQHRFAVDLFYDMCIYKCGCVRADVSGGIHYLRLTDRVILNSGDEAGAFDTDVRTKFEGGGARAAMRGGALYPFGLGIEGELALSAPVGRRSRFLEGDNSERGSDILVVLEMEARLAARLQVLLGCILYRLELGYKMVYAFQAMNRFDLANTGFGAYHGGRDLGFAGPYGSFYIAF